MQRSKGDGDILIGGDGWSNKLRNSIYNVVLFTPEPLYVETKVWGEARHSAAITASFFGERIEALGTRNVCAFVSDTESKMKAFWDLLKARFPWLVIIPCASHCLDPLFADIWKHPVSGRSMLFVSSMTQYWRQHSLPKSVLERCQRSEYGQYLQLQRPGDTRWKSQHDAAEALLETEVAMEKAVVDSVFKNECVSSGTTEQRKAAVEAAPAVKDDKNWTELAMVAQMLGPLANALDAGQSNEHGLGKVRSALFRLQDHFGTFKYPISAGPTLKQHVMKSFLDRKRYTLRPIHSLAYIRDPRYMDNPRQPGTAELARALDLLKSLAAAHDVKLALASRKLTTEDELPDGYPPKTGDKIIEEYTAFQSRSAGHMVIPVVWEESAVKNPLSWWKHWGYDVPHLQAVAVKIIKMPMGFAAGERSFSNAANIQSKLRTRLAYSTLHTLLYIYYNYRSLPEIPDGASFSDSADRGSYSVQLDGAVDGDGVPEDNALSLAEAAAIIDDNESDGGSGKPREQGHSQEDDAPIPATQLLNTD